MGKKAATKPAPEVGVLLLCGLPGSGKSTFSAQLAKRGWIVISQDVLGSQAECTKLLEKSLKHNHSVVIDRCNVTPSERKLWVQRARAAYQGAMRIETAFMDVPPSLCKTRVAARKAHPTLGADNLDVIDQFCRGMKFPEKWEGPYSDCFTIKCDQHIKDLLVRYHDTQNIDTSATLSEGSGWETPVAPKPASKASKPSSKSAKANTVTSDSTGPSKPGPYTGQLFMVRHGERTDRVGMTVSNPDDCAITKKGREQARKAGEFIASRTTTVAAVYSSPFLRCVETAAEIAGQVGVPFLRIEPGLAELYAERIFRRDPVLTPPKVVSSTIMERCHIGIDTSVAPVVANMPEYPEGGRAANKRICDTVSALLQAHRNEVIVLVTHAHGLTQATSNIPKLHKQMSNPRPDYCALTHIDSSLTALLATDVVYRSSVSGAGISKFLSDVALPPPPAKGKFGKAWNWVETEDDESDEEQEEDDDEEDEYQISEILDLPLEEAAAMYPKFAKFYNHGNAAQKKAFKASWDAGEKKIREKVAQMLKQGIFDEAAHVDHDRAPNKFRLVSFDVQVLKKGELPLVVKELQAVQPDVLCLQSVAEDDIQHLEAFNTSGRYNTSTCSVGKRPCITFCLKNLTPVFHNAVLDEGHTVTFCTAYHENTTVVVCNAVMFTAGQSDKVFAMMEGNVKSVGECVAMVASDSSISTTAAPAGYKHCCEGANVLISEGKYKSDEVKLLHKQAFGHGGVDMILTLEEVAGVKAGLPKFPRTQHLYSVGKGSVGRDDLLLSAEDAKSYHSEKTVVEEKIDGSNLGIWFDEDMNVVCMNRGKAVTSSSGSQWGKLDAWLDEKRSELYKILGQRYTLYGEWMVARHSISYTKLPDYFIAFDVYDKRAGRFLGVRPRNELIRSTSLYVIRPISTSVHPDKASLTSLLSTQSYYTSAVIEGVYIRVDTPDGLWLDKRAKIVNAEFMEGIEEGHWQKRAMEKNSLKY
eukprot:TRINITY_DN16073_c0_g1_i1.p1 TRINITY_DN16073_c0_g1~~TRINITY_DN16073_c0_g1_i1.p1  ORF type:complete len:981 (+),score=235.85 TRINITY_DN16073_c0_g1_i1:37-2979(+)